MRVEINNEESMFVSPKVSIIVPVYNVNKLYMETCLDSIIMQTYKELEIILVDDGSTDDLSVYCDEFAKKDKRVRVIHQKNAGVSVARNNGTVVATGAYIMYVDADDILAEFAVEEAVNALTLTNADIVYAAVMKIKKYEDFYTLRATNLQDIVLNGSDVAVCLKRQYLSSNVNEMNGVNGCGYINRGPYSRLISSDLAKKNKFICNLPIGEDVLWNMSLLNETSNVCVVKNIWYGYLIMPNSAIRKYYGNREEIAKKFLTILWNDNINFCKMYMQDYIKTMAVEYYCILNYEFLSEKCSLTKHEKKNRVKVLLKHRPWCLLIENKNFLPITYRGLVVFGRLGIWIDFLKLWNKRKK